MKKKDRRTACPGKLDDDTGRTLHQMVRYISDDRRIARYLRISIEMVEWARNQLPIGKHDPITRSRKAMRHERNEDLAPMRDPFFIDCVRGSRALAEAIQREAQKKMAGNRSSPPCRFPTKGRSSPGGPNIGPVDIGEGGVSRNG